EPDGLLAVGGNLNPDTLETAYSKGIFPWYTEGEPIFWWSPSERAVLFPGGLHISKGSRKQLRKLSFTLSSNVAFEQVIHHCAETRALSGTWITEEIVEAYIRMHQLGIAQSVEVWEGEELVGGLYGIKLGSVFCGESMFNLKDNAAKFAFCNLAVTLFKRGYTMIDCQMPNDFLLSLGVISMNRDRFQSLLTSAKDDKSVHWPTIWEPTEF
ncbi:UNVERIFIED_CONTAM: hypothetical protein GTU68_064797, partial [Idotea baltica]|nr:hypothetical protein [Idotea baltica]